MPVSLGKTKYHFVKTTDYAQNHNCNINQKIIPYLKNAMPAAIVIVFVVCLRSEKKGKFNLPSLRKFVMLNLLQRHPKKQE